ncbi:Spo0B domain-containing protein [Paenibacillus yanchengensis]|uniref:Spo0B domain-containing protein n=1 Tax=Paenibacillus yanchengensis TaxID=2035833 RepID=A0ABW4YLA8_9BACL
MNYRIKPYVIATLLLPIISIIVWFEQRWPYLLLAIWLIIVFIYWLQVERKLHERQLDQLTEAMQLANIKTINYHRHDWMNELQVLYGYASLKRYEQGLEYMSQTKDKLMIESQIAKLGSPLLISYLYSFRTLQGYVVLDMDIEGTVVLDQLLAQWRKFSEVMIEIIEIYRLLADTSNLTSNRLVFKLKAENKFVYAQFCYEGQLKDEQQWLDKINNVLKQVATFITIDKLQYTDLQLVAGQQK